MLQQQGNRLDLNGARRLLAEIETALDRSDLVATLDRLSGKPRSRKKPAGRRQR